MCRHAALAIAGSNLESVVFFLCMYHSWGNPESACRVTRHRLARALRGLATRRERARETVGERAKSWAKSVRQQKAQTLKILPPIPNDAAVLDIFKFILHLLFLSLFDHVLTESLALQTVTICAAKPFQHCHRWFFSHLAVMKKECLIMT